MAEEIINLRNLVINQIQTNAQVALDVVTISNQIECLHYIAGYKKDTQHIKDMTLAVILLGLRQELIREGRGDEVGNFWHYVMKLGVTSVTQRTMDRCLAIAGDAYTCNETGDAVHDMAEIVASALYGMPDLEEVLVGRLLHLRDKQKGIDYDSAVWSTIAYAKNYVEVLNREAPELYREVFSKEIVEYAKRAKELDASKFWERIFLDWWGHGV